MIEVLIADDHQMFRELLRRLIENSSGLQVVGEAGDSRAAIDLAAELEPDVVLLDVGMPGAGPTETLQEMRRRAPDSRVLFLTGQPEDHFAVRFLKEGAAGYLTKDRAADEVIEAISRVARGGKYISGKLAERIAMSVGPDANLEPHERLSAREYQVLQLIASGKGTSEIAEELCLSAKTVSTYRSRILEKMGMRNNSEIILYAVRQGLWQG